ncbi:A/G-specific adenine glycosylase [Bacillus salacetis]|uniref:Adenine DNA glycosylase n=1 Tax=Bacillus salacetis TaxID=2315464 RepID=A0A3A1QVF7_9BACI|nr:A/G-specific adenine glycosylase [Bacillus salacetis]RIW32324.1 A/G-specific adenine glycosylase [Bacillus salacetis]
MESNSLAHIGKIDIEAFRKDLLDWFTAEQRQLPWREDSDPYKVWVSEIMLQQTRVDTVIPYFLHFINKFPTIEALASADEEEVLKAWEGLGYYSRARNLQSAVKEVRDTYGGIVPSEPVDIAKLKGVGPYTAGAILSIAYGRPEPAVDGNVMRVLSRILLIWDDIAKPSSRKIFEAAVRELISHDNPSYFNQALMELGALICTPTSPKCLLCPVREHCAAFHQGEQDTLPVKTKKKSVKRLQMGAVVLKTDNGNYLIHKRPSKGLLANLWEFPNVELDSFGSHRKQLEEFLRLEYNVEAKIDNGLLTKIEHVFSHLVWNIDVFTGSVKDISMISEELRAVEEEELVQFAFPVSHQKIWKSYKESCLKD